MEATKKDSLEQLENLQIQHELAIEQAKEQQRNEFMSTQGDTDIAIETLKFKHSDELKEKEELHAQEIQKLISEREAEIEKVRNETQTLVSAEHHRNALDLVKSHAEDLKSAYSKRDLALQEMAAHKSQHSQEIATLNSIIENLNKTIEDLKKDHTNEIPDVAQFEERENSLRAEIENLKAHHDKELEESMEFDAEELQKTKDEFQAEIEKINSNHQQSIKELQEELQKLKDKEGEFSTKDAEIDELHKKIMDYEDHLRVNESKIKEHEIEITNLKNEYKQALIKQKEDSEITQQQFIDLLDIKEKELDDYKKSRRSSKDLEGSKDFDKMSEFMKKLEEKDAKIAELSKLLEDKNMGSRWLEEELDKQEATINSQKKEIEDLRKLTEV